MHGDNPRNSHCDGVGVQIDASNISWWLVEVKISRINSNNERTWSFHYIGHLKRAEGNVRTLPFEGEKKLQDSKKNKHELPH